MTEQTADTAPDKPWHARAICCGRDDGTYDFATRGDAEVFRSHYTAGAGIAGPGMPGGHDRSVIITGPADQEQRDAATVLAEYLESMRADKGMRGMVDECVALAATVRTERDALRRELGVLTSRPDVRQLVATLQRLVAQPTTADAYGDMVVQSIRHVVGRIALDVGVQDAQRGPQRLTAASAMDFPAEAPVEPQRPAEGFGPPRCPTPNPLFVGETCVRVVGHPGDHQDGRGGGWPNRGIAPEDEGIATADVLAQQAADARAYCPGCGLPETNCACG